MPTGGDTPNSHHDSDRQPLIDYHQQKQLLNDPDFHSVIQTARELLELIKEWAPKRDLTLSTLKEIKKLLEESYHKRTIAKVSGASFAIVGSSLAIVGFGLSFVTFGASLGLTIVGAAVAAGGGITMGGADVGDWLVSKSHMKVVDKVIQEDRELSTNIRENAERMSAQVKQLNVRYPSLDEGVILTAISNIMKGGQSAKVLYDGYKLVDAGFDVVKAVFKVGRFASTGAGAARIAWTGINTVAGGLSVAGVVFDAVALPFDFFVLIKGSIDIHKYNSGKGSNCNKANEVAGMIKKLEQNKKKMLQIQSTLEEE